MPVSCGALTSDSAALGLVDIRIDDPDGFIVFLELKCFVINGLNSVFDRNVIIPG